jgi:ubiquinone/menaquinone biosynthesis C-methylase UbiE
MKPDDTLSNPWLSIPWEDYEGHMADPGVRQTQFLSEVFRKVLNQYRPHSVAVLGCATGSGFEHIDPGVTRKVTGIDINPHYLEVLRSRFASTLSGVDLICADLAACDLEREAYDLVHCALVLEYLEPSTVIQKAAAWLRPQGILVVVLQLPSEKVSKVSKTKYRSLERLAPIMKLFGPEVIQSLAIGVGLVETEACKVILQSQKEFYIGHYRKGPS